MTLMRREKLSMSWLPPTIYWNMGPQLLSTSFEATFTYSKNTKPSRTQKPTKTKSSKNSYRTNYKRSRAEPDTLRFCFLTNKNCSKKSNSRCSSAKRWNCTKRAKREIPNSLTTMITEMRGFKSNEWSPKTKNLEITVMNQGKGTRSITTLISCKGIWKSTYGSTLISSMKNSK